MKKALLLVFTFLFIFAAVNAVTQNMTAKKMSQYPSRDQQRMEIVAWQETFENGENGWVYNDGTLPPNMWRNYNSTTDGWVWWMGDTALANGNNIGGYYSHQYLTLDTPAITVPATNATLTFRVKYNVESPSGATSPYTGWDACDVRISTNGGTTWTVLTGTPTYNVSSSYAFGFEHNEGANVAGWGGNSNGWQNASFSLASYAGQSVKIRFAFASDPSYDTSDAPAMFGMMVDDIHLGDFTNDGTSNTGFVANSQVPLGGQLWHVGEAATAPSPTHAMICQNGQGTYNINMLDYLVSPTITLPESGEIKADFQIMGDFTDPNTFPNVDYWGWEISPDNGTSWYAMSNPYNISGNPNYVYSDAPADWSSAVESYSLDGLISDYAGQDVKFRIYFKSDADTPQGSGVMIDNYTIYNVLFLAPPTNLIASSTIGSVNLQWTAPTTGISPQIITSTNENWSSFISDGDAYAMKITNPNDTATQLHAVNFMLYRQNSMPIVGSPTIHVWSNTGGVPGTELLNIASITDIPNMDWKSVDITSNNIMIPANGSVFVGISGIDQGTDTDAQGLLADSTSTVLDSYAQMTGTWATLNESYTGLKNAALSATIWVLDPDAPELTGYKVYHSLSATDNFTVIGDITNPATTTYTHSAPDAGVLNYYKVTAMFGTNETDPTSTVSVFVFNSDYSEVQYDDNSADTGYNVGSNKSVAVKFNHNHSCEVRFAKVYINTVGTAPLIIKLLNADGPSGHPGTLALQFTYPAASLVQGWNTITIPTTNLNAITDADGAFYLSILEYQGSSATGMDTSQTGSSWKKLSSTSDWEPITEGNLMIRAIVHDVVANDNQVEIAPVANLSAYPNPFRTAAHIEFTVPKNGNAKVSVYNLKGQLIRTLQNGVMTAGTHQIMWDGKNDKGDAVSSGVYFTKMETSDKTITHKIVMMK